MPQKKTTRPDAAGPQSVQGTCYHVRRGSGGRLIVLTVNGTSMNMTSGGNLRPEGYGTGSGRAGVTSVLAARPDPGSPVCRTRPAAVPS
ncbi:hypothetical protein [Streptomyces flavofungini]|uniref:hypothetical protein n=1 Tax=Streptomyces flavofungini TaxID=68200 RepID=UPI0025B1F6D5|nr:hypothetical protein [Streptomyces flavofungini]WJV45410.1 hypothetical protein QUY26_07590 [Streptomyces flavofungini]